MQLSAEDIIEELDEEEEEPKYNEGVFRRAAREGLSLWRTHGGPSQREKYEAWKYRSPGSSFDGPIEEEAEEDEEWQPQSSASELGSADERKLLCVVKKHLKAGTVF